MTNTVLFKLPNDLHSARSIRFGLLNIQSMLNKSHDIADLIAERLLDVLVLTETWHHDSSDLCLRRAAPCGYSTLDLARAMDVMNMGSTNHGGLAIVHRNEITLRTKVISTPMSTFEAMACSTSIVGRSLTIIAIYRPGSSQITSVFFDELTTLLESVALTSGHLIILGDFNVHVDDDSCHHATHLCDIFDIFGLVQHANAATHVLGHTLDLVVAGEDVPIADLYIDPPVLSDHALVNFELRVSPPSQRSIVTKMVRNLNKIDKAALNTAINQSAIGHDNCPPDATTEALFDVYHNTLEGVINLCAPLRSVRVKDCPLSPWFDKSYHDMRREARCLERRYRCSGLPADRDAWLVQLKIKKEFLKEKECAFWQGKMASCGGNSKELWRLFNTILQRNTRPNNNDHGLTANDLSIFFEEKIRRVRAALDGTGQPEYRPKVIETACFNSFTTLQQESLRKLVSESATKSCPLDPIPTGLLKDNIDTLLPYLTDICNRSLGEGVLPLSQKRAIVTPILKKQGMDQTVAANYRPISNLTFISKVIERAVAGQLMAYLSEHRMWPATQSAYCSGRSTETALLRVLSDMCEAADSTHVTLAAFLDLSAAFDCVDHVILLEKLRLSYGITGTALNWIKSFLTGRTQCVSFNGSTSLPVTLTCGVPQGSVLGPLLFVLYTADVQAIAAAYGISMHCYADDIQLYVRC